jgi:UDP-N-acetylglucosamine 2-epimerase (non-hydrolysing)
MLLLSGDCVDDKESSFGRRPLPVWLRLALMPAVVSVLGARPNFVKMAPVIAALDRRGIAQHLVHTGQHYDAAMSAELLADLGLRRPDRFLDAGSGSHAVQTARVLIGFERVLMDERPDAVCVGGDVNSTVAVALAAAKLQVPVAHVEAGLRSFDWTMPEEINRVVTDRLSSLLFTHSPEADANLANEGIDGTRVHFVGNTMIDSLRRFEPAARARRPWERLALAEGDYVLVTLHRASNVDAIGRLERIAAALAALARHAAVVFPIHPRTRVRLEAAGLLEDLERAGVHGLEPVGYLDFLGLEAAAGAIVTDSGGVQEEASVLGVPCFTLRPNTERPITITLGTNTLLGDDPAGIAAIRPWHGRRRPAEIPGWDGNAGDRIADVLAATLLQRREVA